LDYVTLPWQPMLQNLNLGSLLFMSSFYKILTSNGMFILPLACMTSFQLNGTITCLGIISLTGRFFFPWWSWRLGCRCHPKFIVMFSLYIEVFFWCVPTFKKFENIKINFLKYQNYLVCEKLYKIQMLGGYFIWFD